MEQKKLRRNIILGFIGVSLLIIGIVVAIFNFNNSSNENKEPEQTEEIDPTSGKTIIDTEGKTPEAYGANPNNPGVLGLEDFLDRGMMEVELENVRSTFYELANKRIEENKEKITQISIDPDSITHTLDTRPNTSQDIYTARLVFNQKDEYFLNVIVDGVTSEMKTEIYKGESKSGAPEYTASKKI